VPAVGEVIRFERSRRVARVKRSVDVSNASYGMWMHMAVTVSWPLSPVDRVQRVWWVLFVVAPWNFNSLSA
jgi:hypothetical protein